MPALIAAAVVTIGSVTVPQRVAYAQAEPSFEVAPVIAGSGRSAAHSAARISRTPRRLAFQRTHVGDIMAFAYGFPLDRIERRPQWMYDDLFNVSVTTAASTGLPEQKLMLQKLLEERFGLVVHRVSNESTVYYLVRGEKVNLTEAADTGDLPEFRTAYQASGVIPGTALQTGPSGPPGLRHISMADLADWLYPRLQLPILDKTGLTGLFDIEISGLPLKNGAEGTIHAVRDALGLDLELHPGTAESLIIDHIEKPKGT
jgi:uncharacterized protein (TIGR03435 family)